MTEKDFHQLRFDICENIRLHTHQPSMGELLELDLYPDVEMKDRGNHLKIEGFLRLKGAYQPAEEATEDRDQYDDEKREELSYIIPVEITLPADRAEMGQISAEIESFDYQVLSPFELQIDAILLIDGLIPEKEEEAAPIEDDVPMFSGSEATIETKSHSEEFDSKKEESVSLEQKGDNEANDSTPLEAVEAFQEEVQPDEEAGEQQHAIEPQEQTALPEEEEGQQIEVDEQVENESDSFDDELDSEQEDWAKWLLKEKEENFTPMKIVIVQENDSVQDLAERYEVPPSQIRQANQLDDQELEKGQTVFIPNKSES